MTGNAGEVLRRLRESSGWTVSELARASGVSATTIANYERGCRADGAIFTPNPAVLMKVAATFPATSSSRLLSAYGVEDGRVQGAAPEAPATDYEPGSHFEFVGRASNNPHHLVFRNPRGELVVLTDRGQ